MTKFSIEEKRKAVERVNEGFSIKQVARETGISEQVIRNVLNHVEGHVREALSQHRYDWTAEERLLFCGVWRCMEANHWSYEETSVQFGIKGSSTVWDWADSISEVWYGRIRRQKTGQTKEMAGALDGTGNHVQVSGSLTKDHIHDQCPGKFQPTIEEGDQDQDGLCQ